MSHADIISLGKSKKLTIKSNWLLFFFIFTPFIVDQIYGYFALVLLVVLPIALITKAMMLIVMIVYLVNQNRVNYITVLVIFSIILTIPLLTDFDNLDYLVEDIRLFIKLLFFPISFFFFSAVMEKGNYNDQFIYKTFRFLFYALFVAITASVFGIGLSNYGLNKDNVSVGFQGYFFAGNELAPLAVMLYAFNLFYHLYNESSVLKLTTVFLIGACTCLLILTKVSIGGFFVCTLLLPVFMNFPQNLLKWRLETYKYYSNLMISGLVIIVAFVIIFLDMILAYYSRLVAVVERSGDIFGARHDWAGIGYDIWVNKYNLLQQFFGAGTSYQFLININNAKKSIEIDPLDIILSNGIVGFSFIYGFWLITLLVMFRKIFQTKDRYFGISIFLLIFMLGASFTSGHIMASSLVGFYLAIIVSYTFNRNQSSYGTK